MSVQLTLVLICYYYKANVLDKYEKQFGDVEHKIILLYLESVAHCNIPWGNFIFMQP